ncbi:MAG: hypothetical protein ACI87E_003000 [Mariniblastus sp.]|jgi:hypothetical protein
MDTHQQLESADAEVAASNMTASKKIHPEDIQAGDFLAISETTYQLGSYCWCGVDATLLPPHEIVHLTFFPIEPLDPLQVKRICLPFVFCKKANRQHQVIDIRLNKLVKLDKQFALSVRKSLKSEANELAKKSKTKKKKSKKRNRNK